MIPISWRKTVHWGISHTQRLWYWGRILSLGCKLHSFESRYRSSGILGISCITVTPCLDIHPSHRIHRPCFQGWKFVQWGNFSICGKKSWRSALEGRTNIPRLWGSRTKCFSKESTFWVSGWTILLDRRSMYCWKDWRRGYQGGMIWGWTWLLIRRSWGWSLFYFHLRSTSCQPWGCLYKERNLNPPCLMLFLP